MVKHLLLGSLLFFSCLLPFTSLAQTTSSAPTAIGKYRYLLLAKAGTISRYRIQIGESITFKRFQDKKLQTMTVLDVRGDAFFVEGLRVPLKEVEKIRLQNHTGGRKVASFVGTLFKAGGSIFTLVGGVNALTNLSEKEKSDRTDGLQTMGAALTLYAVGEGLHVLRRGTYRINEKWTLKVIEMY
ncbi:hypothetical protein ACD591_12290 [Rufibacter glacialis]|uniref:Uncharacterized protein n=1 Tax=Rufibacter glacialis TaxID=1259555 RepID=A0A5M8QRX3_9BACT|nr:hypothetical protein [Rufibacter glacialis]KAA6437253.1 hypothetical protein FOE74_01780 [Rufibacter glacialis]